MKKTYVKPQLWTEAFQPADAIAGNCKIEVGFGDGDAFGTKICQYQDGFLKLFALPSTCNDPWSDGNDNEPCYHTAGDVVGMYFGS